jgi:hypothetical protein
MWLHVSGGEMDLIAAGIILCRMLVDIYYMYITWTELMIGFAQIHGDLAAS